MAYVHFAPRPFDVLLRCGTLDEVAAAADSLRRRIERVEREVGEHERAVGQLNGAPFHALERRLRTAAIRQLRPIAKRLAGDLAKLTKRLDPTAGTEGAGEGTTDD